MSGNTNPDEQGIFTQNLVGDFSALTARAQAVISALSSLTIGQLVSGGIEGAILFIDAGSVLAQDENNLFWATSNKSLGIGTGSPLAKNHIAFADTGLETELGLLLESLSATAYYPKHIVFVNNAYISRTEIVQATPNGLIFQTATNSKYTFQCNLGGGVSVVEISINTLATVDPMLMLKAGYDANIALAIKRASATHSANLFECHPHSSTTPFFAIRNNGAIMPATLADADAANNSIYYSSTASRLVYKDGAGVVNNLY